MAKKLPPYFIKADYDAPCKSCNKVRGTCKYCGKCYDCCECSPVYICPHCHGREFGISGYEDLEPCNCEPCPGCHTRIDRDEEGHYKDNDPRPWCKKCYYDQSPVKHE